MFPDISGSTMQYLANLNQTQQELNQTSAQISSGLRVQQPSDAPGEIAEILQIQANLGQNQQIQSNLSDAQTEVTGADNALQTVISLLQQAQSLATRGADSTATASDRASIAQEVAGLQSEIIAASQTQINGVYIFSGDQPTSPTYQADPSAPEGVQQLMTPTSTRTIDDVSGTAIAVALTAQQIFDPQNTGGTPATGNTFAAINDLLTSLQNNDQAGIANAVTELDNANSYVNQQLAFYGAVENRLTDATTLAQKFQTQQQSDLSNLEDTDETSAALALNQEQVQEQASLSVESNILQMKNIFYYLA